MRRACLFMLLVTGWSILLIMQDRNGWNDRWNIWNGQVAHAQISCPSIDNETACDMAEGCDWDPIECECEYEGCDPIERALCMPPCEWDELICECECPEPCGTYTTQVSSSYEYQECTDNKLYDCIDECVTTSIYDECTDELISESTACELDCVWDGITCC